MQENNLKEIVYIYGEICKEINQENLNGNIKYEVLQLSSLFKRDDYADVIEDLYQGFRKNKDFIHIPDVATIKSNSLVYPIIIARREDNDDLLGISTIKYFENTSSSLNPYFPFEDAKYFELSGLMVREDNISSGFPGVGKTICEIALMGGAYYHNKYPATRMMTVIDARNAPSVNAMRSGLRMIRENERFGEGFELSGHLIGYYEVHDFLTDELTEAQTLVIEFGLTPSYIKDKQNIILEFIRQNGENITTTIKTILQNNLSFYGVEEKSLIEDPECGNVVFYGLNNILDSRIENLSVIPHDSALGNDREEQTRGKVYAYER